MGFVEPFGHAMIEAFLEESELHYLRDRDGDFVVVEDRKTADNGEMVIALLRGSDVTLKKFYRDPGGKIRLQPANAAMKPLTVEARDVILQGVVTGLIRDYSAS